MERKKAWDKIRQSIPGTFYHILKAKNLEKEIRLSKSVLKAQVHFTPYTELDKHYRELADLDDQLEKEREFNKLKEVEFSKRWDLAYERQTHLEEILEKFSEYHDECQKKVAKDVIRAKLTYEAITEKEREIRKLHKELNNLKEVKATIERRRNLCEPFKDFMNQIIKTNGQEYESVQDLIARFEDLKRIRDEKSKKTLEALKEGVKALELQNFEHHDLLEEELAYLEHQSRLDEYNEKLDAYNASLNEKVTRAKTKTHSEILQVELSKMAIYSLYLNLCRQMEKPAVLDKDDQKGQLEFIQRFLVEMAKLTQRVREGLKGGSGIVIPSDVSNYRSHSSSSFSNPIASPVHDIKKGSNMIITAKKKISAGNAALKSSGNLQTWGNKNQTNF